MPNTAETKSNTTTAKKETTTEIGAVTETVDAESTIGSYITDDELTAYISGETPSNQLAQSVVGLITTKTRGIEALPYQFMESVDRRITDTTVGRKYGEKIFGRLPLLFLTPCEPLFMDEFDKSSKNNAVTALLSNSFSDVDGDLSTLINGTGRYYSVDFNYSEYYQYLNTMLACLAAYLGIYDTQISIDEGREPQAIGSIDWSNELNDSFKTFFTCKENIVFYLDGLDSVSESFSNSTSESSLASTINGYSDQAKEIRYLFGSSGNVAAELLNKASDVTSSITASLSGAATDVAGGIVGSLANKGVNSVLNGGKIIFPELWSDSDFSRSYSIDIKLRSPDHDNLSIFLNILKPYCKLLALTLPRAKASDDKNKSIDPNSYYSPFLVKAYSKGLFSVEMGMISSMSVNKGATCCWNDDGLPTQIDISIEIKDLYSHLAMSAISGNVLTSASSISNVVNNTAYMDFLANMAGLNIAQMEIGRRITMAYYLSRTWLSTARSSTFTRLDQGVSKLIGKLYNIL